jgi:hypothetical protein
VQYSHGIAPYYPALIGGQPLSSGIDTVKTIASDYAAAACAPVSGFVVGFRSIEDAFQRIEMPLRRTWAVVELRAANFALGLLDH